MILSASREFDRNRNPLIVDRESDNVELPKVCLIDFQFEFRQEIILVIPRITRCAREN